MTSGSLRNYYKDKINDDANENSNNNNRINNNKTITITSFDHKTKLIESAPNNKIQK